MLFSAGAAIIIADGATDDFNSLAFINVNFYKSTFTQLKFMVSD